MLIGYQNANIPPKFQNMCENNDNRFKPLKYKIFGIFGFQKKDMMFLTYIIRFKTILGRKISKV